MKGTSETIFDSLKNDKHPVTNVYDLLYSTMNYYNVLDTQNIKKMEAGCGQRLTGYLFLDGVSRGSTWSAGKRPVVPSSSIP